jgi:WASH complex subunit 7
MLYTGNSIKFVPDLQHVPEFAPLVGGADDDDDDGDDDGGDNDGLVEKLSAESIAAAANLDRVLRTLADNFAEGTDYFKLLVRVFTRQFRDPKNLHLNNFYVIVPPLMINFVEHSLLMKEKLAKKKAFSGGLYQGSNFTDDGFAIGVAYILKLLDQNDTFDSLHWFDSVHEKFSAERRRLEDEQSSSASASSSSASSSRSSKKQRATAASRREREQERAAAEVTQSLSLTARKMHNYQREFDLLRYSFDGARIFFLFDDHHAQQQPSSSSSDASEEKISEQA